MNYPRASALLRVACAVALGTLSGTAGAQTFPNKPIRIFQGFAVGGTPDLISRAFSPVMSQVLGQPIVIENRIGASGTAAANAVAKAEPDGHTILCAEHGSTVYMHLLMSLPYDPIKELAIIHPSFKGEFILVSWSGAKINSLKDLLAEAKANPGKLNYGHSGNGTVHHLAMELFKQRAGIDLTPVAYKGGGQSIQAVVAGQVPLVISGQNTTDPHIDSGRLKPIATFARERWKTRPEMPTMNELFPGLEAAGWGSFFAPAGTPRDVMLKLNAAVNKALADPETLKRLRAMGLEPPAMTLEQSHQFWMQERDLYHPLVKKLNLKLD